MAAPIPDLTVLQDVAGPSILDALKTNHEREVIYVYIGDILYSINPCKPMPIYGPEIGYGYCGLKELEDRLPHIYGTTHRVYKHLTCHNLPQCVLLRGYSGSGKTESCKMVISQLVRESENIASTPTGTIGTKLTEAMHLLDAFGNASTQLNENASRFTKAVDILFDERGILVGANIEVHHLEKCRVLCPWEEECNFNIFYHLLAGLSTSELRSFHLQGEYRLISPIPNKPVFQQEAEFEFHKERFNYVKETIETLGLNFQLTRYRIDDLKLIFGLLAAMLHLGNIQFYTDPTGGSAVANYQELDMASRLLLVNPQELSSLFSSVTTYVHGRPVNKGTTREEAAGIRDVLLQSVYNRLFDWLIYHINISLYPSELHIADLQCITVVDPPGFEARSQNSLEQLHINLLSEQLHQYINDAIFSKEYEDCKFEGVGHPTVVYWNDNKELLELLDLRGVVGMIETISAQPTGNDIVLLERLNKTMKKRKRYTGNKIGTYFTIHHTPATVNYSVNDIIRKNRDNVPIVINDVMSRSTNPLVSQLFSDTSNDNQMTLSQKYQLSSSKLIEKMSGKQLHLISCIKPNPGTEPGYFDPAYVMKQLEVTSAIELVKIRRNGYSVRSSQDDFLYRYKFIGLPLTASIRSLPEACCRIIQRCGLTSPHILVTKSMVFMQYYHVDRLNERLAEEVRKVIIVQSCIRRYFVLKFIRRLLRRSGRRDFTRQERHSRRDDRGYYGGRSRDQISRRDNGYTREGYFNGEEYNSVIPSTLTGLTRFYQDQLDRVLEKRNSLDPITWCKLVYLERDKELAKFYITEHDIRIDGSHEEYDVQNIGLGIFRNPIRDDETRAIRSYIREGLTLKRDPDGNIWATRHCDEDIIVHGYRDPANHCLSADIIINRGRIPFRNPIKIFDVNELKGHIGLEMQSSMFNKDRLLHLCIVCLSFVTEGREMLETPCWLCVINLIAIDMVESPGVLKEVQNHLTQLKLESRDYREIRQEENILHNEIKQRHQRPSWSKSNQRKSLEFRESSPSKLRMELRKKGQPIKQHMNYSWNEQYQNKNKKSLEELQNQFSDETPAVDYYDQSYAREQPYNQRSIQLNGREGYGQSQRKDWAKIKVHLKKDDARLEHEYQYDRRPSHIMY
ncbi:unconventional myosin-IXAa [Patella vulgata]|uniref:unconventional myosin-IXAa n=1 Tax=Patella vulgata TaxID=6465 RepID=UPI0024A9C1BE|nr:unconventional myosin-IXAa [Patella vulgata]